MIAGEDGSTSHDYSKLVQAAFGGSFEFRQNFPGRAHWRLQRGRNSACDRRVPIRRSRRPTAATSQAALLAKTLATLNLSSPIADLDANWDRKDLRFIGINSYTCMAPGVGGADTALPQRYGLRCLFGTSDFLESRAHAALMNKARRYAARYNAELVRRIRRDQ